MRATVLTHPISYSCGGATEDVSVSLGGSSTITQSVTASADVGFDLDGLTIGGGVETSTSKESTTSQTITFSIPPGKQAVYVAGIAHTSETGHVQVNYGSRQFGHFIVSPSSPVFLFEGRRRSGGTGY